MGGFKAITWNTTERIITLIKDGRDINANKWMDILKEKKDKTLINPFKINIRRLFCRKLNLVSCIVCKENKIRGNLEFERHYMDDESTSNLKGIKDFQLSKDCSWHFAHEQNGIAFNKM